MSNQHQLDARIDDVQIHKTIGDGWECIFIRDNMGIKQYVYDVKHHIGFVYQGDIGSTPIIGVMFIFYCI